MKTVTLSNRGQVLVIFVFAIIGLIGITGLAIDGSNIYSDRRHAQNAADTAALAGALFRVDQEKFHAASTTDCGNIPPSGPYGACASAIINTALDRGTTNGYTNLVNGTVVEVHTPPIDGYYASCTYPCHPSDYIQVIIKTNVNTFFARVLGIGQLHNTVEAVALAHYSPAGSLFGGMSLIQLKPSSGSCTGDFSLGGSGTVNLSGGGIFVNSDNPTCAFKQVNCIVNLQLTNGAILQGVGGPNTSLHCANAPTMSSGKTPIPFPPDPPFPASVPLPPLACSQTPAAMVLDGDGFSHYYPGHYSMLPPDKNTRLDPGVYCVDNVIKTTNPTYLVSGDHGEGGVFIYIKSGGSFNFQGGIVKLSAMATGPYAGYLIYVDSDFTGSAPNCTINGNSNSTFTGVIYAPYCDTNINGGSLPTGLTAQVVAYTLTINGGSILNFFYDATKMPKVPEMMYTGLYH